MQEEERREKEPSINTGDRGRKENFTESKIGKVSRNGQLFVSARSSYRAGRHRRCGSCCRSCQISTGVDLKFVFFLEKISHFSFLHIQDFFLTSYKFQLSTFHLLFSSIRCILQRLIILYQKFSVFIIFHHDHPFKILRTFREFYSFGYLFQ